jgi:hypothetical protein
MCNVICLFRFVTLHFRNHTEILNVRNYFFIYIRYINYINIKYRPSGSSTFSMCIVMRIKEFILYACDLACGNCNNFRPKCGTAISARNTKVYKICELCKPYRNQTLQFYSFQYALSSCCDLFASPCLVLKLVYNGNCLFFNRLRVFHFMPP